MTRRPDNPRLFLQTMMRRDFPTFLRKAFSTIRGGDQLAWNWHLGAMAHVLDQVASGASRRSLINLPPRNLKSLMISVAWVAWMLGHDPRRNFVCVSYSNELSTKFGRECLAIMQSGWYRALFPGTIISAKRSAAHDFETTQGGGRLATSITGTLTGRGGDTIIIDDPIKPDEANSEVLREAVNEWYKSTLSSRLNDKASGAILVVMQRLHEHDLPGMLLEAGGWDRLNLPAIAPDDEIIPLAYGKCHYRRRGDVLHPAREPLHVLQELRASMGSAAFVAQYLQDPLPALGNTVQAAWLKYYAEDFDPYASPGFIVQSWDTATKDGAHNDFSVCVTAIVTRREIRVLDVYRARLQFPELKRHCIRLAREWHPTTLLIEDHASGSQLLQTLRSETPSGVPAPLGRTADTDKESRMLGAAAQIEAGRLLLPQDAGWLTEFKAELLGFPNARYDDQCDALSQLMNWVQRREIFSPDTISGPIGFTFEDDGSTLITGDIHGIFTDGVSPTDLSYDPWSPPSDDPWLSWVL